MDHVLKYLDNINVFILFNDCFDESQKTFFFKWERNFLNTNADNFPEKSMYLIQNLNEKFLSYYYLCTKDAGY